MWPSGAAHVSIMTQPLPEALAERVARIRAKAADLQGSMEAGEAWLASPAFAFARKRPADLLATEDGAEAVETLLGRLDYGVYT